MVVGRVARLHCIALARPQLHPTARRSERGGRRKAPDHDIGASVEGHARDDQCSADDAEGSLPHGGAGGEPPSTSRARL